MQKTRPALIAYYYFDFKDVAKCDLRDLLSSLLTQLCGDSDRCWSVLSQLYTGCRNGSEQPREDALVGCLRKIPELPGQVPIYVIVDAIDECPNNTGTPSPVRMSWIFWRVLSGGNFRIYTFVLRAVPSRTYKLFLIPGNWLPTRVPSPGRRTKRGYYQLCPRFRLQGLGNEEMEGRG
jgi:hypothetical protein